MNLVSNRPLDQRIQADAGCIGVDFLHLSHGLTDRQPVVHHDLEQLATQLGLAQGFEVKVPNATTKKAIAELEAGKGKKFTSVDALMADLHADD